MRTHARGVVAVALALVIAAAATTASCIGDGDVVAPDARDALFDLGAFVAYQDSVLAGRGIRKTVRVGETVEEKVIGDVDWAAELAAFAGANVNKPALTDAYLRERVGRGAGGGSEITLTATDSAARVRVIEVACASDAEGHACPYGDVEAVRVETRFESLIADTEQRLRWTPEKYEVVSRQQVVGRDERVLVLEGVVVE